MKKVTINFDMDGTIANLYGVNNWLEKLMLEDPSPYIDAKPLINLRLLAYRLNKLQKSGFELVIISWLSKNASDEYSEAIKKAKIAWLKKHLPSVKWDKVNIIPYGTPKSNYCNTSTDVLFDDEEKNRQEWYGKAYNEKEIFHALQIMCLKSRNK